MPVDIGELTDSESDARNSELEEMMSDSDEDEDDDYGYNHNKLIHEDEDRDTDGMGENDGEEDDWGSNTDLKLQYSRNNGRTEVKCDYLCKILQCLSKLGSGKDRIRLSW